MRLPKLVQLATPVTRCWMLGWWKKKALSEGTVSELNRKFRQKSRQTWHVRVAVSADIRAAPSRPHSPSQSAKCGHFTHSHVRQVFITDCRKSGVVPVWWKWATERSYEVAWTLIRWFKHSNMTRENYDFTCLMSRQPSSAIPFLPHRKHSISMANTVWFFRY